METEQTLPVLGSLSRQGRHSSLLRRAMFLCVIAIVIRYHYWRITSLPPLTLDWTTWAVYSFCALELFVAYFTLRGHGLLVDFSDRRPDADRNLHWYGSPEDAPLIDILIPTYDEGRDVLRPTVLAASRQRYSRFRVWLLDDGQRPDVAALAAELGVNYLARAAPTQFKAGNLNHALQHLRSLEEKPQYFAVFDADFVAYPAFLERTLALMHDPRVAIVQTPQCFYNPDPFQHAFRAPAEWPEDWRENAVLLACRDAKGMASCFGTSFLARIDPVCAVGGFPTESLLEDWLLSIKLAWAGWQTVYLNQRLSVGLNVSSLDALAIQRARWYRGEMQMLAQEWQACRRMRAWRPLWHLFQSQVYWFADPALRLLWLIVPLVYWATGVAIVPATTRDVLLYCAPMLARHVFLYWVSRGAIMPIARQVEQLILAPVRLRVGVLSLLGRGDNRFRVTPKGTGKHSVTLQRQMLLSMALLGLSLASSVVLRIGYGWPDPNAERFVVWNVAATAICLLLLLLAMVSCVHRPRYRGAERYPHHGRVRYRTANATGECELLDISVTGARVSVIPGSLPADKVHVVVGPELEVESRIVRQIGGKELGLRWQPTVEQEGKLVELVLCSPRYVPQPERWRWWTFCAALLTNAKPFGPSMH